MAHVYLKATKARPKTCKVITSKTFMLVSSVRFCFLSNQPLTARALCASEISLQDVATVWWEKQIGSLLLRNAVDENKLCEASPKLVQPLMTFPWIASWILVGSNDTEMTVTHPSTTDARLSYTPHPNENRQHVRVCGLCLCFHLWTKKKN